MRSLLRGAPRIDDEGHEAVVADEFEETADEHVVTTSPPAQPKSMRVRRIVVWAVLPAVALILAVVAGALKWQTHQMALDPSAVADSVRAASDGTVAILSYRPDTVEQDLGAARDRLTGSFSDDYAKLTSDVVIPGAREKSITAKATVAAAASVTASQDHAVVIVFVDQTTTIGASPPSDSASSIRVTLDKRSGRWLISGFDPV
jgi:Mce-associated membrane protein